MATHPQKRKLETIQPAGEVQSTVKKKRKSKFDPDAEVLILSPEQIMELDGRTDTEDPDAPDVPLPLMLTRSGIWTEGGKLNIRNRWKIHIGTLTCEMFVYRVLAFLHGLLDSQQLLENGETWGDYDIDHLDHLRPHDHRKLNLDPKTKSNHTKKTNKQSNRRSPGPAMSKPCIHVDSKTGKETRYSSITEACRQAGRCHGTISYYIIHNNHGWSWDTDWVKKQQEIAEGAKQHPTLGVWVSPKGYILMSIKKIWTPGYCPADSKTNSSDSKYMYVKCNRKSYRIQIIVCETFHGPKPSSKHSVDHEDGNPRNNCAENLRWYTPKQQAVNRRWSKEGKESSSHKKNKRFQYKPIEDTKWTDATSVNGLSRDMRFLRCNIHKCCNGKQKKYKGYHFRWHPEDVEMDRRRKEVAFRTTIRELVEALASEDKKAQFRKLFGP